MDGGGDAKSPRRTRARSPSVSSWPREDPTTTPPSNKPRRSPRKQDRPSRSAASCPEETDSTILARRQKQLDYGKNTLAYQQYVASIPRAQRKGYHPRTPMKHRRLSRRHWDHAVKCWRVQLHYWNRPAKLAELRVGASEAPGPGAPSGMGDEVQDKERTCDDVEDLGACGGGDGAASNLPIDSEAKDDVVDDFGGCDDQEAMHLEWADDVEGLAAEFL